jgi:hypothetical protein
VESEAEAHLGITDEINERAAIRTVQAAIITCASVSGASLANAKDIAKTVQSAERVLMYSYGHWMEEGLLS